MQTLKSRRKLWVLIAMTSCIAMIFIDATILPVALPTIQRELGISDLGLQWIINSYLLALTALVLAGGRIGDIFGHRRVFCTGLLLFAVASALCGLSNNAFEFIVSRFLQGCGGALLIPATSSIIQETYAPNERGKALGITVSIGSLFLTLGPFVGGLFTEYLTWRFAFWINLPIALFGLILSLIVVEKTPGKKQIFDVLGFFCLAFGITSVILAFMQVHEWGWPAFFGLLFLGLFLLFMLIRIDRKAKHPFIDVKLLKDRSFVGGCLSTFCAQFILMVTIFWAIYFQLYFGYSPAYAGILSLICNLPVIFVAPIAGHLADRYGPRRPIMLGFSLMVFSLVWFVIFGQIKSFWWLLPTLLPLGAGASLIFTPSAVATFYHIEAHQRGVASGLSQTVRQFGATLGMALLGGVILTIQHLRLNFLMKGEPSLHGVDSRSLDGLLSNAPSALEALQRVPQGEISFVKASYLKAYVTAFSGLNLVAAGIAVVGIIIASVYLGKHPQHHPKE